MPAKFADLIGYLKHFNESDLMLLLYAYDVMECMDDLSCNDLIRMFLDEIPEEDLTLDSVKQIAKQIKIDLSID
jgi:hypothetical protein